jgi:hypothetical protein
MTSRSGGLIELVARGKKDLYFSQNPSVSFFHSVYRTASPFTKEIYVVTSRNAPEWGRYVDFDIDHRGDVVKHMYLRVQLPTWLPPVAVAANARGLVTDASGVTFGYTNKVGFQMLEKIQFFVDQVMIHETFGEYLDWRLPQAYGFAETQIIADQIGVHDDSSLGIGRAASPSELRIPIPFLGSQWLHEPGFPMVAMRNQRFRIRFYIRRLEELIVASDGRIAPAPWGGHTLRIQTSATGAVDTSQVTRPLSDLTPFTMMLETTQLYIPPSVQLFLKASTLTFPFLHTQFEQFTIADNQFNAASAAFNATIQIPLAVDSIGAASRLMLGIRSDASTRAGQRSVLRSVDNRPYIQSARLNIANLDRIQPWEPAVFREVTAYWKQVSSTAYEVYTLTFGGFDVPLPLGTLSFTRAVLPVLYITLAAIGLDRRTRSRLGYALLYTESWNVWEIRNGAGQLKFEDS